MRYKTVTEKGNSMAVIHKITTYRISYELENDIRKKALSEEEIANVFEQFSSKNKLLTKRNIFRIIFFFYFAIF